MLDPVEVALVVCVVELVELAVVVRVDVAEVLMEVLAVLVTVVVEPDGATNCKMVTVRYRRLVGIGGSEAHEVALASSTSTESNHNSTFDVASKLYPPTAYIAPLCAATARPALPTCSAGNVAESPGTSISDVAQLSSATVYTSTVVRVAQSSLFASKSNFEFPPVLQRNDGCGGKLRPPQRQRGGIGWRCSGPNQRTVICLDVHRPLRFRCCTQA